MQSQPAQVWTHRKYMSVEEDFACILVNPSVVVKVENSYKDIDGRIIAIDVICKGVNLSICNVYAPTNSQL